MNSKLKTHYALTVIGFLLLGLMTWLAAKPPRPLSILLLTGAGLLLGVAITFYRDRAGHFK